ncbi:hypothetical protein EAF04_003562 [Stromatinia cepivora]|nr:hypothetical protein EAF04_003562 [Stromatinia cepivora]
MEDEDDEIRQRRKLIDTIEEKIAADHAINTTIINEIRTIKRQHEDNLRGTDATYKDMHDDPEGFATQLLEAAENSPPPPALVEQALIILEAAKIDISGLNESVRELATSRFLEIKKLTSRRWKEKYEQLRDQQRVRPQPRPQPQPQPVQDFSALNSELRQQLTAANDQLATVNLRLTELRKSKLGNEQELQTKINGLEEVKSSQVLKIADLDGQIETQSSSIDSNNREIQRLNDQVRFLGDNLTAEQKAHTETNRLLGDMKWQRDEWEEATGESIDKLAVLQMAKKSSTEIQHIKTLNVNKDNEIRLLNVDKKALRNEIAKDLDARVEGTSKSRDASAESHDEVTSDLKAEISDSYEKVISDYVNSKKRKASEVTDYQDEDETRTVNSKSHNLAPSRNKNAKPEDYWKTALTSQFAIMLNLRPQSYDSDHGINFLRGLICRCLVHPESLDNHDLWKKIAKEKKDLRWRCLLEICKPEELDYEKLSLMTDESTQCLKCKNQSLKFCVQVAQKTKGRSVRLVKQQ